MSEWMWKHIAGISPSSPAFATVSIRPRVDCKLGPAAVQASLLTPHGKLEVQWQRMAGGAVHLNVTVPVGVRASVHVPKPCLSGRQSVRVTESGDTLWPRGTKSSASTGSMPGGVDMARQTADGGVQVEVGAGAYKFAAQGGGT